MIGTITYPNNPEPGHLIYCKAAVTDDAPWEVRSYQDRNPAFPNHSTLFQLFDDERFEAYRALGFHTAQIANRAAIRRGVLPVP